MEITRNLLKEKMEKPKNNIKKYSQSINWIWFLKFKKKIKNILEVHSGALVYQKSPFQTFYRTLNLFLHFYKQVYYIMIY